MSYMPSPACTSALHLSVVTHGTLSTDKGPPTYHLQGQEGDRCDLAHGKRISSVSRKTYSWPALYGTHSAHTLYKCTMTGYKIVSEVYITITFDSLAMSIDASLDKIHAPC